MANCIAAQPNSASRLYLVIDLVPLTASTSDVPLFLFLMTAREGRLSVNTTSGAIFANQWRRRLRRLGVVVVVCRNTGNDDRHVVKTGETAVVLNRG